MRPLVYIAGASREWRRAMDCAARLARAATVEYEVPWWRTAAQWTGSDARLTVDEQRTIAREDIDGIWRADLVWVLWPDTDGRSAVETELGLALRCELPIVVSGHRASESIFTALADVRESSDDVALVEIVKRLGGR